MALRVEPAARKAVGLVRLITPFALLLIIPTGGFAAQSRATGVPLSGIVRDTTGLVLPGAMVELGPAELALTRSTASAADGTFVFSDVRVGLYRLRVSFPDFESFD